MYLPKPDAARLLQTIAQRFYRSQFVLDMVNEKVTRGLLGKMIDWQYKFFLGLNAPWEFGLKDPRDMETYGSGLKVIDVLNPGGAYGSIIFVITASINGNAQ